MYRGKISFDDPEESIGGRNSEKRAAWYRVYYRTEKYKAYKREYMRKKRQEIKSVK
jgi:hypothetical protein